MCHNTIKVGRNGLETRMRVEHALRRDVDWATLVGSRTVRGVTHNMSGASGGLEVAANVGAACHIPTRARPFLPARPPNIRRGVRGGVRECDSLPAAASRVPYASTAAFWLSTKRRKCT